MKKGRRFGKALALLVALLMAFGTVPQMAFGQSETENTGTVKVTVENDIWSSEEGAAWTGKLITDKEVAIDGSSTLLSILKSALDSEQKTMNDISTETVSEINGVANGEAGADCLWKAFVGDRDINQKFADYSVANGNVVNGSVIKLKYSGTVEKKDASAGGEDSDEEDGDVPLLTKSPRNSGPAEITTYVTLSNQGSIAVGRDEAKTQITDVPVTVAASDGQATVDAVMQKLHEEYCPGGYDAPGGWVSKLWEIETSNTLFFINGKGLASGVTVDKVKDGDRITASINKDNAYYADWYTSFDSQNKNVKAGEEFTLSLTGFQGMNGGEAKAVAGVKIGTVDKGEFTQTAGKTTDKNGAVTLSFDKAGTYYVSAEGTVKDTVMDWSTGGSVEADCPIIAPVCKVTVTEDITAYVTVSNKGVFAIGKDADRTQMAGVPVTVSTADGQATVDAVIQKLHEEYCPGGYDAAGGWVSKLWGVSTYNTLFFVNGKGLTTGVAVDKVKDGDRITASVNADDTNYADWYTSFGEDSKTVGANEDFSLTLTGYQGMSGGEAKPVGNVKIGVMSDGNFIQIGDKKTDKDGKVSLSFENVGTYYISAEGTVKDTVTDWSTMEQKEVDCPIIAPVCKIIVTREITAYVTVSNKGKIAVGSDAAQTQMIDVPVKVETKDGQATVDAVMKKVHEKYCPDGYSAPGGWVSKLWGVSTGNTLFFVNGKGLATGVTVDKIKDGDRITASVNADDAYYADWYTSFDSQSKKVKTGEEFTLSLTGFQGMNAGEAKAVAGVKIGTVDKGEFTQTADKTTGENGAVTLSFDKAGIYYVSAEGTVKDTVTDWNTYPPAQKEADCPIIAPICKVEVVDANEALWDEGAEAYLISTKEDLKTFRNSLGRGVTYEGKSVYLMSNIALTAGDDVGFAGSIGGSETFDGNFNGRGHTVSGWSKETEGLFPIIGEKGSVSNLVMDAVSLNPGTGFALAYYNSGLIEKCQVSGSITGTGTGYTGYVYSNAGTIRNCLSAVTIDSSKSAVSAKASGFANSNGGTITNCIFAGQLSIVKGKLYPFAEKGTITNCYYIDNGYKEVAGATALTSDQMKDKASLAGFDFDSVWEIKEGADYSTLKYDFTGITRQIELKLVASVGDYTYDKNVSIKDCVFPLSYRLEYAGDNDKIKADFDKILEDYDCKATLNKSKWNEDFAVTTLNDGIGKDFSKKKVSDYYTLEYKSNDKYDFQISSYEFEDAVGVYHDDKTISNTLSDEEKQAQVQKAEAAVKTILDAIVKADGAGAYKDPFFAFTCARAGYYPEGVTKGKLYGALVSVWKEYEAYQKEKGKKPETTEVSKFVLAFAAMGYDPKDCDGINFIDELNGSDDNGKYFASHYKAYALYSIKDDSYKTIIKGLVDSLIKNSKDDSYSADDMATMYAQPIFLLYDPDAQESDADAYAIKKYVEEQILPWMSRSQNGYGLYKSEFMSGSTNVWTDAQAQMLIGLLGADFLSEDFVKNGNSMIGYITEHPELSLGFASDKSQCARSLVTLLRALKGEADLFDCSDVEKVITEAATKAVIKKIDDIGTVTLNSGNKIADARRSYDGLSSKQKELVTNYDTLTAAEKAFKELKEQQSQKASSAAALKTATKAITKSVNASLGGSVKEAKSKIEQVLNPSDSANRLPENMEEITDEQLKSVIDAYKAYDLLSDDEKLLVNSYKDFEKVLEKIGRVMHLDKETGITIDKAEWYQKLEVSQREFSSEELVQIKEAFGQDAVLLAGYDIHVIDLLTGEKAELKKSIKVKMPSPDKNGQESIAVVHINENGEYEFIKAVEKGKQLSYDAQSFSPYAVIGFNGTWEDVMGTSEETGGIPVWIWVGLGAVALIAILIIAAMRNKNRIQQ